MFKSTKDLINETILFSRFEHNKYYEKLHDLTKFATKLNVVARIEIQLVDQLRRLSSVPTPLLGSLSSQIRFRYLINHARYEITSGLVSCHPSRLKLNFMNQNATWLILLTSHVQDLWL